MNPDLTPDHAPGRAGDHDDRRLTYTSITASVHPTALVGNTAEWIGRDTTHAVAIGKRCIIRAFVTIDRGCERNTVVGADTLLMAHVHIGHDAQIGQRCHIAPGAVVCGLVTIGDDVKIGANASIRPGVTVGDGARIGMGAVVTKDIPAGEVWAGNPARKLR